MEPFLHALITMPTGLFTAALGLVLLYWLFVILGFFDLELFDVDLDLDGAAEGLGGGLAGMMAALGLTGVPITIVVSFVTLFSWLISLLANLYLLPLLPEGPLFDLGDIAIAIVALIIALPLAGRAITPLRPLFAISGGANRQGLVGKLCTITSGKVDARHGQARCEEGGRDLILSVTCHDETIHLVRGDRALIIDHDTASDSYAVMPYDGL